MTLDKFSIFLCLCLSLTIDINLDRIVGSSPEPVEWHTQIGSCVIISGLLNHVNSCKTGSKVDTVTIKPVLAGRWVGVSYASQCNATISLDYCIQVIGS